MTSGGPEQSPPRARTQPRRPTRWTRVPPRTRLQSPPRQSQPRQRRPPQPRQPAPRQPQPLGPWPSSPRQSRQAYHRTRTRRQANARCPWRRPRTQPPHGARRPWHAPRAWDWADPLGWACGYGSCCRHLPYVATFPVAAAIGFFSSMIPRHAQKRRPRRTAFRIVLPRPTRNVAMPHANRDDRGCSECAGTR